MRNAVGIAAIGVCFVLATSVHAQRASRPGAVEPGKATFVEFDAPGAGTTAGQGTNALSINTAGVIAGDYRDANNFYHGFVRSTGGPSPPSMHLLRLTPT